MHISSLIVHVRPAQAAAVQAELLGWPGIEVPAATPEGQWVVTVESATDREASESFARIGAIPGVMSVALVYHQFEADPAEAEPEEARHG